ncbi:MAG: hypothetical protein NC340_01580 [Ruminococcus flavefaciens]|nr:hypothetical protein [Ruminococcus flavefaciens]MCM1228838.1 hypothetical protein [Ruminococcus flavefaciens]
MGKLKLSALVLATMLLSSCSYMNDDGTLKSAKSYETVELNNFSFDLRNGFDKKESSFDNAMKLTFKNDVELYVTSDYDCKVCTPEVLNQDYERYSLSLESTSTEVLNIADKEISVIHTDAYGKYDFAKYTYMTDASSFIISFDCEPKDRELFDALATEIMESLTYIGHSETSTENEFISVEPEDIWFCKSDESSVTCMYAYAENLSQYLSGCTIEVMTNGEFDTAEEYAEHEYMKNGEDTEYIQEPRETEFYGKKAYLQEYKKDDTDISVYFVDYDGITYRICTEIYESDGSEDVRESIDRVLENVAFKSVSDERRTEINKSSVSDYTKPHFRYSISDFYEAPYDKNLSYLESNTGNTIEIDEVERDTLEHHYSFYDYDVAQAGGYETIQAGGNTITAVKAEYSSGGGEYTKYVYMNEHYALIISINTDLGDRAEVIRKNKRIMDFFASIESKE